LSRFRLNTDLHITPYFRLFFEGKSALSTDRDLQGRNIIAPDSTIRPTFLTALPTS